MTELPILRAFIVLFLAGTARITDSMPTPTPTPTARAVVDMYMPEMVDFFRIENSWECGGSIHDCVANEPDPLILTRVAMAESPSSLNDRAYVMWNIKMRSALGFKNAPYYSGPYNDEFPDRWGPETTIAEEALCFGGCQYEVMRSAQHLYYGCGLPDTAWNRAMFCPTDEQLGDFFLTYQLAIKIVNADITDMPYELRGYDGFRSPQISWNGRIDWDGGLPSRWFFPRANVWRDEYPKDNIFWDNIQAGMTPTPLPTPTATITPTLEPTSTATPSLVIVADFEEPHWIEITKEDDMLQEPWTTLLFLLLVPLLIQGFKIWAERVGKPVPPFAIQIILFGVSFIFIFFNEGVLGWSLPVLGEDVVGYIAEWGKMISSLFALTMALYEVVYKAVMEKIKFATKAALTGVMLLFM
jgi:hypothetical protein